MGDYGAQDTSRITTRERHTRLRALAVIALLARQRFVNLLHDRLKRREFHHRVGNLSTPERVQALVQPAHTLRRNDLGHPIPSPLRERRERSLHPHLHSLERTESNISEEFGTSRTSKIDPGLVLVRIIGSDEIGVSFLEELVAAVFERALDAVAEEGWAAAGVDPAIAVGGDDFAPAVDVAGVHFCVDLAAAFY